METRIQRADTDPYAYPDTVGIYRLPIEYLRNEFKYSHTMQSRISDLEGKEFSHWRKARGDGN